MAATHSVFAEGVEDLNSLAVDLRQAADRVEEQAPVIIAKTGEDVVSDAQVFVPVRTGNLQGSIGVDIDDDGLGFTAGPTADYGAFVEFGTVHMAPRAYLGPAFDRRVPDAVKAFEELGGRVFE